MEAVTAAKIQRVYEKLLVDPKPLTPKAREINAIINNGPPADPVSAKSRTSALVNVSPEIAKRI